MRLSRTMYQPSGGAGAISSRSHIGDRAPRVFVFPRNRASDFRAMGMVAIVVGPLSAGSTRRIQGPTCSLLYLHSDMAHASD